MSLTAQARAELNRFSSIFRKNSIGNNIHRAPEVVQADYSFATLGGAVSTITLSSVVQDVVIPADSIVTRVFVEEVTNVTSGGAATVTLSAGATALTGAIAIASFAGITAPALAGSVAGIKISANSDLTVTIATAALTAGVLRFHVEFIPA